MTDPNQLPAIPARDDFDFGLGTRTSPALQVFLNEKLFDRARTIAGYMSKAEGAMPKHLIGKMEACFAIFTRAISWRLDPFMVAASTYQTPGGSIGYEGKLCQAIMENSGMIEGQIAYEHFNNVTVKPKKPADAAPVTGVRSNDPRLDQWRKDGATITNDSTWDDLVGKFDMVAGQSGRGKYPVASWDDKLEIGLGVTVKAQIKGEKKPREFTFYLVQAEPRNSTLWVTDPRTQICYLAIRRFSSVAAPGIFMGVPVAREEWDEDARARNARDITPPASDGRRPSQAAASAGDHEEDPPKEEGFDVADESGVIYTSCPLASDWIKEVLAKTAPTVDNKFTDKAQNILLNNADATERVCAACADDDLVTALQQRYIVAEAAKIDADEERIAEAKRIAETEKKETDAAKDRPVAEQIKPAAAEGPTPQQPAAAGAVPKAAEASADSEVGRDRSDTSVPAEGGQSAAPAPADPKPMEMPKTARGKADAAKYFGMISAEIALATQPEYVDAILDREKSNIANKELPDGTRRSINMLAARHKNGLLEGSSKS